ncbi:hypothetical protein CBR_g36953 [Chara braunii]|uniref:Cns1/TTC4 wheel domain-containing protein n=1 Tax=Chara braunii TaxID=69332 RepID=A0A388JZF6_CHABU|nr:hypothetical protein CBR_g36953 [Chara braunii]|eukprot:GBG63184.1 hypothetical protein CBR_g36953 [Chara braunii]
MKELGKRNRQRKKKNKEWEMPTTTTAKKKKKKKRKKKAWPQEQGNRLLKKGHNFYREALKLYTQAISQKSSIDANSSIYYANRAQVNLLLGNNRRAFEDAVQAVKHNPENVKAYFRGAKAALALDVLDGAADCCAKGLSKDQNNVELQKLQVTISEKRAKKELEARKEAASRAAAERIVNALSKRKVKIGPEAFREWTGGKRPWLDSDEILHFPVVLLYGEVMTADLIEDFSETDRFSAHLNQMFGEEAPPLEWDVRGEYTRRRIELYFQTNAYRTLSRPELVASFMEGQEGTARGGSAGAKEEESEERLDLLEKRWVKVDEKATLATVLSKTGHVIPGN